MFDSVGEIFSWLEKRGWNPEWAHPQNDEIDLMMKNTQQYLKRLVMGAGNLTEQVENRKRAFEVSQALEDEDDETNFKKYEEATIENELEYEDEGALVKEIETQDVGDDGI